MTEIEQLRAEIAALRREISDLKTARTTVIHNHYHNPSNSFLPQGPRPSYLGGPIPACGPGLQGRAVGIGYADAAS